MLGEANDDFGNLGFDDVGIGGGSPAFEDEALPNLTGIRGDAAIAEAEDQELGVG